MKVLLLILSLGFISLRAAFAADDIAYPFISNLADSTEYKAALTACDYLRTKMYYTFSGDSCTVYVPAKQTGRGPAIPDPPIREYAKLSVIVSTTLTEADKLNGEEWRGIVKLRAEAGRTGRQGKWYPVEDVITNVRVYIKNGRWFVGS